jgi:hypothetical protein
MKQGILFSIAEMLRELESAEELATPFVENAQSFFGEVRTQLIGIRNEYTDREISWEVPLIRSLRTQVSKGEHEKGSKGRWVAGKLAFKWQILRVHPKKHKSPAEQFELVGIASTVVRVVHVDNDGTHGDEIAMWRTEVGDAQSPGCHFHVQIRGETEDLPFPKSLAVPRLPTCLATPMAAMEFMLGELFQERWLERISAQTNVLNTWRAIQRSRMERLFEWHLKEIRDSHASPWLALKGAKPQRRIFVS